MVQTFVRIKTKPLQRAELVKALRSVMRLAHAGKGFISCGLYLDAVDDDTVCYEELWESREDMEEQIRSLRFMHLLALMESAIEQPLLAFRAISETQGLEYVAALRGEA